MTQSERYIQLHTELWEAFCDSWAVSHFQNAAHYFIHWLRNHSGVYQPACREYLELLWRMMG